MKKFTNILFLSVLLAGIVFIWLIPKTKGEKKTQYVRVYTKERDQAMDEDSSKADKSTEASRKEKKATEETTSKKSKREIVQIDTLNGTLNMEDIQPSLYSRSMHFKRVKTIELDSIYPASVDSASISAMKQSE